MNRRRLASLAGVGTLGLAVLAVVARWNVSVGAGDLLVPAIGLVALVEALRVVRARWRDGPDEIEMPTPELPAATPAPGGELEAVLAEFRGVDRIHYRQSRVREGLTAVAVATLTEYAGLEEATARERVAAGSWTDDARAAAFLAGDVPPRPAIHDRVLARLRGESTFARSVRRTVDAIAATAGIEPRPGAEPEPIRRPDGDRPGAGPDAGDGRGNTGTGAGRAIGGLADGGDHETGHWGGVSVAALAGLGVGILAERPAVLLAGAVGAAFVAYARSGLYAPGDAAVSLERSLEPERPEPGEQVEVTVTLRNEGDGVLPDLRVVDGVPAALGVEDGSPRHGTALRPGEEATFTYALAARRGVHEFGPATLAVRDLTGALEHELSAGAETTVRCVPSLRAGTSVLALRGDARQVGRVGTDTGGAGTEFYATREYRSGDPLSRIDWNRRARTGELTTVEFREERAARVVLLVDARAAAYVSPGTHAPHAVERSVEAAGRLYATLTAAGNRVGVAAVGAEDCWLPPGAGLDHEAAVRDLLATHPALAPVPDREERPAPTARWGGKRWRRRFRRRLAGGTQVVLLTPLVDEAGARLAREFEAYGFPVTVLSPDPTADRTSGNRLARVTRALRASELRRAGIPVLDWGPDEPVDAAVERHNERWQA